MYIDNLAMKDLVFKVPKKGRSIDTVVELLNKHKEIEFVSYVGIDFGGNGTDERIPVELFLEDIEKQLMSGVQTDGSSVTLPGIATLDDAKVVILPDRDVDWYVDYNYNSTNIDGKYVGTLIIPSFLIHNEKMVCSRSILKRASSRLKEEAVNFVKNSEKFRKEINLDSHEDIENIILTSATELEFWVQSPEDIADEEKLSVSQTLKEQYWKRTEGNVRSAMEKSLEIIKKYGFEPEMGHKEVGGVTSQINPYGNQVHVMEQLEIDWKYSEDILAADIEMIVRNVVKEIFHKFNLEVTFSAKPIEGVAGSGKHTHIGIAAKLKSGKHINLFSHKDFKENYASSFALSSLMGILKNYEVINPFVAPTIDSLNRLKPHFEAPICIVSSLGRSADVPSRNRSILIGLIKDPNSPMATRFELRSPNPLTNVYLVLAACYQSMIDGIKNVGDKLTLEELLKEFSKSYEEKAVYLEDNRMYRSEENVFDYFTEEERNKYFGKPPATVYENIVNFDNYPKKLNILKEKDVFTDSIIKSYRTYILDTWVYELAHRIIDDNMEIVRKCKKSHTNNDDISDLDIVNWTKINNMRWDLMKDSLEKKSVFTLIKDAIEINDYETVSRLQLDMNKKISDLKLEYSRYRKNLF